MSKIRINELARELEVKPNVILETLAELGIADKKTHSSSLDDDVALQVRHRVTGESGTAPEGAHTREIAAEHPAAAEPAREHSPKPHAAKPEPSAGPTAEPMVKETQQTKTVEEVPAAPVRLAPPLRPPLSVGGSFSPPSIPLPHAAPPRPAP